MNLLKIFIIIFFAFISRIESFGQPITLPILIFDSPTINFGETQISQKKCSTQVITKNGNEIPRFVSYDNIYPPFYGTVKGVESLLQNQKLTSSICFQPKSYGTYTQRVYINYESRSNHSIALLFDLSTSMNSKLNDGVKRIDAALAAGKSFINSMINDGTLVDEGAIFQFASTFKQNTVFTTDKTILINGLNGTLSQRTAFYDGVGNTIMSLRSRPYQRVLIALTDGEDNASKAYTLSSCISLANQYNIKIFTVGVGSSISNSVLSTMATSTGGEFYTANSSKELLNIYDKIFKKLTNSYIYYFDLVGTSSPPPDTIDVTLKKEIVICEGEKFILNKSIKTNVKNYKTNWQGPNGFYSDESEPELIADSSMNGYFIHHFLYGTKTHLDSTLVKVNNKPKAIISPSNYQEICSGDTANFNIKLLDSNITYKWNTDLTGLNLNVNSTGKHILYLENSNGCKDSIEIELVVNPRPEPKIDGNLLSCLDDVSIYKLITKSKPQIVIDGGSIIAQTDSTISIKWEKQGICSVKIIETDTVNGCVGESIINVQVDSLRIPKIKQNGALCKGSKITLSLPELYYKYEWSNGEISPEIEINQGGIYIVKAYVNDLCFAFDTINVIEQNPTVKIIGENTICKGGYLYLEAKGDFINVLWSTGEKNENITITKPGIYSVIAIDSAGCTIEDSIKIIEKTLDLQMKSIFDFGKVCYGETAYSSFNIFNNSNEIIYIDTIYLKKNDDFKLNNQIFQIGINETKNLNISFNSSLMNYYNDTLKVHISNPCLIDYEIPVTALANAKLLVWTPDTTAEIGENYQIPFYAKLVCGSEINDNFRSQINIEKSLIDPSKNQNIGLSVKGIIEENLQTLIADKIKLKKEESIKFNQLSGLILYANNKKTPVIFNDFVLNNPMIDVEIINGSVTINSPCAGDLRRVIALIPDFDYIINPNPASDFIEISYDYLLYKQKSETNSENEINTTEKKKIVYIFNSIGENITQMVSSNQDGKLRIDITFLPIGVYYLKFNNRLKKFIKV